MRTLSILILLIFISTSLFSQTKEQTIDRYILKNFRVPDSLKKDCNWNYLAVELSLNKKGELNYQIKNYTSAVFNR